MDSKVCSKCGQEQTLDQFYVQRRKGVVQGYSAICRTCHKAYSRQYYQDHKESEKARKQQWAEAHRDYYAQWRADNREYMQEYERQRSEARKPYERAYNQAYYEANKERLKAYEREYYEEHREERRAYSKWYRQTHSRKVRRSVNRWRKENREAWLAQVHRRRARKRNAPGDYTAAEWEALLAQYEYRCLACGSTEELTVDHVIPLSKGGSNHAHNLQPLCRSCNSTKRDRYADYRPEMEQWGFT